MPAAAAPIGQDLPGRRGGRRSRRDEDAGRERGAAPGGLAPVRVMRSIQDGAWLHLAGAPGALRGGSVAAALAGLSFAHAGILASSRRRKQGGWRGLTPAASATARPAQ